MGKVIHKELCKRLKSDYADKWYIHKQESVRENETHKILLDFGIQTDHLIPARKPNLVLINKKKRSCQVVDYSVPAYHRANMKESEKIDQYLDLASRQKKLWDMRVAMIPVVIGPLGTVPKDLEKRQETGAQEKN